MMPHRDLMLPGCETIEPNVLYRERTPPAGGGPTEGYFYLQRARYPTSDDLCRLLTEAAQRTPDSPVHSDASHQSGELIPPQLAQAMSHLPRSVRERLRQSEQYASRFLSIMPLEPIGAQGSFVTLGYLTMPMGMSLAVHEMEPRHFTEVVSAAAIAPALVREGLGRQWGAHFVLDTQGAVPLEAEPVEVVIVDQQDPQGWSYADESHQRRIMEHMSGPRRGLVDPAAVAQIPDSNRYMDASRLTIGIWGFINAVANIQFD